MIRAQLPPVISTGRVIPIARRLPASQIDTLVEVLVSSGLEVLEVTLDADDAVDLIHSLGDSGLLVGAGTVASVEAAARAVEAGAAFLVSPHTDESIVSWAVANGIPVMPGALTPTEVATAWRLGATAVKLFPASVVGASGLRTVRGPFPDVPIVPTGGITGDNAADFLSAGAVAVGVGSWLTAVTDRGLLSDRASQLAALASSR